MKILLVLGLAILTGCSTIKPVPPYAHTVRAEEFVKEQMNVPKDKYAVFVSEALEFCLVGIDSRMLVTRGSYIPSYGYICYDGTGEVYAHEVAHVYGANEAEAWVIGKRYKELYGDN